MTMTRTNWQRAEEALELTKKMEAMTGVDDLRSQVSDALCHFMHLCRLMRDEEGDEIHFDDCLMSARINFEAEADEDPDDAPLDPAQRHEAEQERITTECMERLGEHLGVPSKRVFENPQWTEDQIAEIKGQTPNHAPMQINKISFSKSSATGKTEDHCKAALKPDAAWEAENLEKARALMIGLAKTIIAQYKPDKSSDLQDRRDSAIILAALRHYQRDLMREGDWIAHDILDIATDGGTLEPMTAEEIDDLCDDRSNL